MYPNLDFQNFYETTLSNDLAIGATDVFLTIVPTPSEGFLTIDPEGANPEIIWYSSKTSSKVVCPAGGRGFDGTSAQAWTSGTKVIMAPVAETQRQIKNAASTLTSTVTAGWIPLSQTVGAVTYNGQRSYNLTMSADVSATLSPGMRVRTTRTVSAPTQCTSLNGTTQYWTKASPTGVTFTGNFTISAWVKLSSYPSTTVGILGRDSTAATGSGFEFDINSNGSLSVYWRNATAASQIQSYLSIPLNKWVHIAAACNVASPTSTALYIDGVSVPKQDTSTSATSLVQASTNLTIGWRNSTAGSAGYFPGKIAQAALFSAQLSQATIQSYISQGLSGTETSLVSAYSFNGNANDLNTTNANNLTAQGSAVATNADSPFSENSFGTPSGTLDYGIIVNVATTTLTVQVPEGCTIPTSGGVSAISYSTQKAPYGMPVDTERWNLYFRGIGWAFTSGAPVQNTYYGGTTNGVTLPIGVWDVGYHCVVQHNSTAAGTSDCFITLSTSTTAQSDDRYNHWDYRATSTANVFHVATAYKENRIPVTAATNYYLIGRTTVASMTNLSLRQELVASVWAKFGYL